MRRRDAIQIGLHVWELQRYRVWGERSVVLGWGKRLLSPVGKALSQLFQRRLKGLLQAIRSGSASLGLGASPAAPTVDRRRTEPN